MNIIERVKKVNALTSKALIQKCQLQGIVDLTATLFSFPMVYISLVSDESQTILSSCGLDADMPKIPVSKSFCSHTILQDDILEVPNLLHDGRFSNHFAVTEAPNLRYYIGAPIITHDGLRLGALCLIDTKPNRFSDNNKSILKSLSLQVATLLDFELERMDLQEFGAGFYNAHSKLMAFFKNDSGVHFLMDQHMKVFDFNGAASNLIWQVHHQILEADKSILSYCKEDFRTLFSELFNESVKSLQRINFKKKILFFDNTEMWWELEFIPLKSDDKVAVMLNLKNIDDKVKLEEKALMLDEALRKIARIQSHDIRKPLANILGLIELLKFADADRVRYMSLLENEALNLDENIRKIISISNKGNTNGMCRN